MIRILSLCMICGVLLGAAPAPDDQQAAAKSASLSKIAFLAGHWRGEEGLVFEEIWSAPEGGVMTAMARGVAEGQLRVLEYIIVTEEDDTLVMRFKHFNADYSTWEEDGAMIELWLTDHGENDVTFSADPPSETVKSVRYWKPAEDQLQADVVLTHEGGEDRFSLKFERVD